MGEEGDERAVLNAKIIVFADGARSSMRDRLGIAWRELEQRTYFISGVLNVNVKGTLTRRIDQTKHKENVRQIVVGHHSNGQAWTLVEVPLRKVGKLQSDPTLARRYYLKHANRVLLDVPGLAPLRRRETDIVFGGNTPFPVVQVEVDDAVCGRFYGFGDALGTGHFLTSGGINTLAVFHAPALARAARAEIDYTSIGKAREEYTAATLGATSDWREVGTSEFRASVPVNFGQNFSRGSQSIQRDYGTFNDIVPILKQGFRVGLSAEEFAERLRNLPDVNAVDGDGNTIAHHLAQSASTSIEYDLLSVIVGQVGVDLSSHNFAGMTARQIAAARFLSPTVFKLQR